VENIALPLLLAGRRRKQALAAAAPWLSRLGLDGLGERLPGELSDEPTGSLDSVAADQVMELLVDAAREQATSVLMVTHEPRVAAYADRTVLVRDGVDALGVAAS
jgi:putative ABC transport system ATP-binding protein